MPLNFTVNEPVSWIGYSVDGKTPIALTEYVILPHYTLGPDTYATTTNDI